MGSFGNFEHNARACSFEPDARRCTIQTNCGQFFAGADRADKTFDLGTPVIHLGDDGAQIGFGFSDFERSHKSDLVIDQDTGRLLMNLCPQHGVREDCVHTGDIDSVVATPIGSQRPKLLLARIIEGTICVGPAGRLACAKFLLPINLRMSAMSAIEGHSMRGDIAARPTGSHSQQFGIKEHVGIGGYADGQPFQSHVFRRKIGTDARPLKRKVLLKQPGMTFPSRAGGQGTSSEAKKEDKGKVAEPRVSACVL